MIFLSEKEPDITNDESEKIEEQRVKEERERIKKLGLETKSKNAFSILTDVDKDKEEERQKKLRKTKFVGF